MDASIDEAGFPGWIVPLAWLQALLAVALSIAIGAEWVALPW